MNVRAYVGLLACTKAVAAHRSYKPDADDSGLNDRLQQRALAYLTQHYASHAPAEIAAAGAFRWLLLAPSAAVSVSGLSCTRVVLWSCVDVVAATTAFTTF